MSGSDMAGAEGVYGSLGAASASNVPGARYGAVSWTDSSGNFWLFGGEGYGGNGYGYLNDLWEFSPSTKEWTWMGGSNALNAAGVYGIQGSASTSNVPGARYGAVSWTDNSGNFWLFGGSQYTPLTSTEYFNDLWEFNPSTKEWTWVSGSDTPGAVVYGVYGTLGVASASNVPGARGDAVSWIDSSGNLWLFGGTGYSSSVYVTYGYLNDLWEFSPSTKEWTWVSGGNGADAAGIYGTLGIASVSNYPGGKSGSVSWTDSSGNLWLFGGVGISTSSGTVSAADLNDLWEFNPSTKEWTWVSGSDTLNAAGVYGTQGVASPSNVPAARDSAVGWTDASGNFWLFGGSNSSSGSFWNDLWEFKPSTTEWKWIGGSESVNAEGNYGTEGVASATNDPGARGGAAGWIDSSGNLWLFGGVDNSDTYMNDLWRYQP